MTPRWPLQRLRIEQVAGVTHGLEQGDAARLACSVSRKRGTSRSMLRSNSGVRPAGAGHSSGVTEAPTSARTGSCACSTPTSKIGAWVDLVAASYNVLPMDGATFRTWARLIHRQSDTSYEDAVIAATAADHGLTVMTRNTADFKPFKVRLFDPFKPAGA